VKKAQVTGTYYKPVITDKDHNLEVLGWALQMRWTSLGLRLTFRSIPMSQAMFAVSVTSVGDGVSTCF
jgi:hypothetical protein